MSLIRNCFNVDPWFFEKALSNWLKWNKSMIYDIIKKCNKENCTNVVELHFNCPEQFVFSNQSLNKPEF